MAGSYQVIYAEEAKQDIDKILHYLNSNYGEATAKSILSKILKEVETIPNQPESYSRYLPERTTFKRQYRYATAGKSYRIVFTIILKENIIRIVSVRHVKMDNAPTIQRIEEE